MKTKNTTQKIQNPTIEDKYQIQPILQEIILYRRWKPNTTQLYHITLRQYCEYHQATLPQLITEAENDEEHIHKVSKRTIKKRLHTFTLHLQEQGKQASTIRVILSRISLVYHFFDIEIPRLPRLRIENTEHFEDLPTREEIQYVLNHVNTKTRALITALASSGLRISDLSHITVGEFLQCCREYVVSPGGVKDFLLQLQNSGDLIVPVLYIRSQKTGIPYNTFFSDEASRYIVEYLLEYMRKKMLSLDDPLLHMNAHSMSVRFTRLNTKFAMGRLLTRGRFHAHALRKFFATTLVNAGCDFLTVEFLLGHKLDAVKEAYYKADKEMLKAKYLGYMSYVTFLEDVRVREVSSSELEELEELRAFKRESVERIRHLEEMMTLMNEKI